MKNINMILSRLSIFLLCLMILAFGCKEDDTGCTDPTAGNFDSEALVDNGSCDSYAKNDFIGKYLGSLSCSKMLVKDILDNDSLDFELKEPIDNSDALDIIMSIQIEGLPVDFASRISDDGRSFSLSDTLQNFTLPPFPPIVEEPAPADIFGSGTATISNDKSTVTGTLSLFMELKDGSGISIEDDCAFTGIKL